MAKSFRLLSFVTTTLLCHYSSEAATDNPEMNEGDCLPIKLFFKNVAGSNPDSSFADPGLKVGVVHTIPKYHWTGQHRFIH